MIYRGLKVIQGNGYVTIMGNNQCFMMGIGNKFLNDEKLREIVDRYISVRE